MEYQEQNQEQAHVQNQGGNNLLIKQTLPNSTAALVLGIISIVTACCCLGVPGLITGVIGLVLGINASKLYVNNKDDYTESSFKNANAGKICSIVGLAFGLIMVVRFAMQWTIITEIIRSAIDGTLDPSDYGSWF